MVTPGSAVEDGGTAPGGVAMPWDELVAHATLGTDRRPDVAHIAVLGQDVPIGLTAEERLLAAAAMTWVAGRASRVPAVLAVEADAWAPPGPEDRLAAPPAATQLLDVILAGGVLRAGTATLLLRRWLQVAGSAGWRVPDRLRAATFDRAGADLPGPAAAALGEQGRWLTEHNPAWAEVLVDTDDAAGWLAAAEPRVSHGRAAAHLWREDPARGRRVLLAAWDTLSPSRRAQVIAGMTAHVQMADEPWLEDALHAGPAGLSHAAASALCRLPDSRRGQRMADRLVGLVDVPTSRRPRSLRRPALVWRDHLPSAQELGDATEAPPASGVSAWWRAQVILGAPLSTWQQALPTPTPTAAVTALARHGALDDQPLLALLIRACLAQRDSGWATALLPSVLAHGEDEAPGTGLLAGQLGGRWVSVVTMALQALPGPWDAETTGLVLGWILRHARLGGALAELSALLADRGDPVLDRDLAEPEQLGPSGDLVLQRAIGTIRTIRSLRSAIDSMTDPPPDGPTTDRQGT